MRASPCGALPAHAGPAAGARRRPRLPGDVHAHRCREHGGRHAPASRRRRVGGCGDAVRMPTRHLLRLPHPTDLRPRTRPAYR
ncbi:hypothetical protein FHS40_004718 [Streptomyces spectabilis]|uniref:Uncharacterized protein n=1 Tax=Streptomyces spectabilis TaxID=68270 RepID=A0A7W8AYV3_STRST|nr:hypothetical protein [Streptomyces spectabilis]